MDALTAQSIRRLCGRLEAMRAGGQIRALMAEYRVGAPEEERQPLEEFGEAKWQHGSLRQLPDGQNCRSVWLLAEPPQLAVFVSACADAARVAIPALHKAGFVVGLGTTNETNAWLWSVFEMAALQLPGVPLRLVGGDIYRATADGVTINETAVSNAAADPSNHPLAALALSVGPTRYWRLENAVEASLAVLDIASAAPQQQSATATPADGRKRKKREETVAETLRRLWKTKEGRDKILAAGSAEKIAILIGCSKTQVLASGRIWKEEIKSRLKTQRTLDRYHRDEERLDG